MLNQKEIVVVEMEEIEEEIMKNNQITEELWQRAQKLWKRIQKHNVRNWDDVFTAYVGIKKYYQVGMVL